MSRDTEVSMGDPTAAADGKSRVLVVAPQPFLAARGTPLNVLQLCRALTALGYEVHLLTFPMGDDVAMTGLRHRRVFRLPLISRVPIGFSLRKAAYDVLLAVAVANALWRDQFVAVHAIEEAAFFAAPLARAFGVQLVSDLDSDICQQLRTARSFFGRALARVAEQVRRRTLHRSACAITVAPALTRLVATLSPETPVFEIADIPVDASAEPADAGVVAALKRRFVVGTAPVVLYTGNFDERQGVDLLVRAMPRVRSIIPNAVLLLVGGEPAEIARMRSLAASAGVARGVIFAGKHAPDLMGAFMQLAVVLVSPRREPLVTPLKLYSYMASGRPIVATDMPTHTNVVPEDAAILVPATADGIADGILQALRDPVGAERRAARAREIVRRSHTFAEFRRRVGEVYEYVGGLRRGP